MATATIHAAVASADLQLTGSYESTGDVLYLSAPGDNKRGSVQLTPEGHGVRLAADGRITHITAISARRYLDRDGEIVASLRDGRQLRLTRADVVDLLPR